MENLIETSRLSLARRPRVASALKWRSALKSFGTQRYTKLSHDQRTMVKGQAICLSLLSIWFCGRGSVCHHGPEIEVVGELTEFCKKAHNKWPVP